ncbi:MAG: bifunctional nuclease family protein [Phycisphaerales bacterium]|nr:bifunctional nuclease family protein [Phycisphaerales bacterium]
MLVRMDLARTIIVETSDSQVIILKERDGDRHLPILIGINEALAIDRRLKGLRTPRPMTHDLLANVIETLGCECEQIVISDLRDHTFYATLIIRRDGELMEVDARPSDAIALGVASGTPIFVESHVLEEASKTT